MFDSSNGYKAVSLIQCLTVLMVINYFFKSLPFVCVRERYVYSFDTMFDSSNGYKAVVNLIQCLTVLLVIKLLLV